MRSYFVFIFLQFGFGLVGQNPELEGYSRIFPDTFFYKSTGNNFKYSLKGSFEIKLHSQTSKDSSFVVIQFINIDSSRRDLWLAMPGDSLNCICEEEWTIFSPEIPLRRPSIAFVSFLRIKWQEGVSFSLKKKDLSQTFGFSTYLIGDYNELVERNVPGDHKINYFDYEGKIGVKIPYKVPLEYGVVHIAIGGLPVKLKSSEIEFIISNNDF